jgi:hypothetical protein
MKKNNKSKNKRKVHFKEQKKNLIKVKKNDLPDINIVNIENEENSEEEEFKKNHKIR